VKTPLENFTNDKGELTTTKITAEEDIPYHPFFLPAYVHSGVMKRVHEPCLS
jgi:hypothetical protein